MRFHVQTTGMTLPSTEPLNNIGRSAIQGLPQFWRGVSLCISILMMRPTRRPRKRRLSRIPADAADHSDRDGRRKHRRSPCRFILSRISHGGDDEAGICVCREYRSHGGLVSAVESGWLHREISNYNNKYQGYRNRRDEGRRCETS